MRKALPAMGAVLASAFYVAWPAYSGYRIRDALETHDAAALSAKVDFESVRTSLKPIVSERLSVEFEKLIKQAGPLGGLLGDDLKTKALEKITDGIVNAMVTPEMLIRVHEQGGNFKEALETIIRERSRQANALGAVLGSGGDGGDAGGPPGAAAVPLEGSGAQATNEPQAVAGKPRKRKFDINNVKGAGLDGPLGVHLSVARNPAASEPDITVRFRFTDGDWKLTALEPRL